MCYVHKTKYDIILGFCFEVSEQRKKKIKEVENMNNIRNWIMATWFVHLIIQKSISNFSKN